MTPTSLLVFDIETVPDLDCVPALTHVESTDSGVLRAALGRYYLELTDGRSDFPKPPFHRVVAISFLSADIQRNGKCESYDLRAFRSGCRLDAEEADLVRGFFRLVSKEHPRLVSFNGRGFDLSVLRYRAMHYGISCPAFYDSSNRYENYLARYSQEWHCDLVDVLADYGASTKVKLSEISAALRLPGKVGDLDGSKVADLFEAGRLNDIRSYCLVDVLNTYLVYLRLMLHRGTLSREDHDCATSALLNSVRERTGSEPMLGLFASEWDSLAEQRRVG